MSARATIEVEREDALLICVLLDNRITALQEMEITATRGGLPAEKVREMLGRALALKERAAVAYVSVS